MFSKIFVAFAGKEGRVFFFLLLIISDRATINITLLAEKLSPCWLLIFEIKNYIFKKHKLCKNAMKL